MCDASFPCYCAFFLLAGWADIRLLAPRAELRLLLTGSAALIDGQKLSYLGEALRALLVLEMRGLQVGCLGWEMWAWVNRVNAWASTLSSASQVLWEQQQ
jgi:hypothetical protein